MFELNEKYIKIDGSFVLSGPQAIVKLALLQKEIDERNGLNTAGYVSGYRGSGGGGGYSGGGTGSQQSNNSNHQGGGGGSYNSGSNTSNSSGARSNHGQVIITKQ